MNAIDHRWRGGDQVNPEFAIQSLSNDFEVQQSEKPAAKAEAKSGRSFGFEGEARVVKMQFAQSVPQSFKFRGIDRKKPAKHNLLRRFESRQWSFRSTLLICDGVAHFCVGDLLDGCG